MRVIRQDLVSGVGKQSRQGVLSDALTLKICRIVNMLASIFSLTNELAINPQSGKIIS